MGRSMLIVDDDASVREALRRAFRGRDWTISTAADAVSCIEEYKRDRPDVVLLDHGLPGLSGLDLLGVLRKRDPDAVVIMLTGRAEIPMAVEAMRLGAENFLTKPFDPAHLDAAAERAFEHAERGALQARRRTAPRGVSIRGTLSRRRRHGRRRTGGVRPATSIAHPESIEMSPATARTVPRCPTCELPDRHARPTRVALRSRPGHTPATPEAGVGVRVVAALVEAMEAKDIFRGHSRRVSALAAAVARTMGLDGGTVEDMRTAGRLHDVGKTGIRDEVLHKPGRLSAEEYEHIKAHVRIGVEILAPLHDLGAVRDYVHHHHENVDGSGYPQGLRGDAISLGGRILAAADRFDALTSRRSYREPLTHRAALELLAADAGTAIDAEVYAALCRSVSRVGATRGSYA